MSTQSDGEGRRPDPEISADFGILGPLRIVVDDRTVPVTAAKVQVLAGLLLVGSPRPVPLSALVDELWDVEPPRSAIPNVRTYAARLRRVLPGGRLTTTDCGYRLVVGPGELDADRVDGLAARADAASGRGDPAEAARLLGLALGQWRGRPFEGMPAGRVLAAERIELEDRYRALVEGEVRARLALGEHRRVVPVLRRYVVENPLREPARELLMLALYLAGDTASALQVFTDARAALSRELGIEPGPRLHQLQRAILAGEPVAAPPGRDDVVVGGGVPLPDPGPAGREASDGWRVRPHELPRCPAWPPAARGELARVVAALGGGPPRPYGTVVVVVGRPGSAASALAVQAAHRVAHRFPDGQVYLDFADTDASDAAGRVLRSLGVAAEQVGGHPAEAAARLRSVLFDRRVLLLLDNVTDEAQVRPLLPARAGCAAVVAGSVRLAGVEDAVRVEIGPFAGAVRR